MYHNQHTDNTHVVVAHVPVMHVVHMLVQWFPMQQPMCPVKPSVMQEIQRCNTHQTPQYVLHNIMPAPCRGAFVGRNGGQPMRATISTDGHCHGNV